MIHIRFQQVWVILLIVAVWLVAAHVVSLLLTHLYGHPHQLGFERLLALDREHNLASWYSSLILLIGALLLALIWRLSHRRADPLSRYWLGLAVVFFCIAVDESATIHETVIGRLLVTTLPTFNASGYLLYPWILAGAVFVCVIGVTYLRFLSRLPATTRWGLILAGILYVSGALGMDVLEGNEESTVGQRTLSYELLVAMEESLEMAGILTLLYVLSRYIASTFGDVSLILKEER
jgi:hypothetical protein